MIGGNTPRQLNPASFKIADWREMFDLYPDQWLAIAVDEITPGVGITAGHIIARGKKDGRVFAKLKEFMSSHPEHEVALLYTGKMFRSFMDII